MRTTENIILSSEEYQVLNTWANVRSIPLRLVQRAQIIVMAASGILNQDIAKKLGISRPTVQLWRSRFLSLRLSGLKKDAPRPGRIPKISQAKIKAVIEATINTVPPNATHWSTRSMAKAQGLSEATVRRIWKKHNLKPHLRKTFKLSSDRHFVQKLYDIVGLYLNPPDRSLVLCVDEKSQIQALERTQPSLPIKKGRCGTYYTHDYKRNGTTTLFAALSMLDGKVIGGCMPRHRHHEFIRFLKKINKETAFGLDLHLIVDNYSTHKHPQVKSWLEVHPRFHLHFTPTSSSWLNLVERFFAEITNKRIRRGSFKNVSVLIKAIKEYLDSHNQNPQVFVWSAPVERILEKIAKCKEALDAVH
ncbi:MAG: IS630 family transposase [Actinobacteria bacterium]|nr:IS630 family transposase [Actinomycetota bacterium]